MARKRTRQIFFDFLIMLFVISPTLVIYIGKVSPTKRGFFCNDPTILYPNLETTLPSWLVAAVAFTISAALFIVTEVLQYRRALGQGVVIPNKDVCCCSVNPCLYSIFSFYFMMLFGSLITQSVTDIAKYSSGQLRPNFVKACQPSVELSSCSDGQYITNFTCLAVDQMEEYELRTSFPSAHASGAAFAATYLSCYVQQRVPRFDYTYLVKHVIQFILICMAWFCGLSRVMDNKHHPTDVLAGFTIGTVVALLCALYTTKKFTNPFITTHRVVNREYGTCSSSSDLDTDEMTQTSYLKTINQI